MRWPYFLLLALLLAPGLARGDEADIEQRKRDLILRLRVHQAINSGAAWVAKQQRKDGSFSEGSHAFGETALATYTMAHCGYTAERKEVRRAVSHLRKRYKSAMRGEFSRKASTYSLALTVLALHTLYARHPDEAKANARYGGAIRSNPCRYPAWARKMIWSALDWLLEHQAKEGLFRYPGAPSRPGAAGAGGGRGPRPGPRRGGPDRHLEDLSNTQYVLLALWVGSRCGYEVKKETCEAIAKRLLEWQEARGPRVARHWDPQPEGGPRLYGTFDHVRGFGYTFRNAPTGSMTAAGLSSVLIVKAILLEQHRLDSDLGVAMDKSIWDAIAWHTRNYSIRSNPPGRGRKTWHYYYLYGLERALEIGGKRHLGDHDWYREGAEMLVDAQRKDGRWLGGSPSSDFLDTCFALLFLKRAAPKPMVPLLPAPTITPGD